MQSFTTIFLPLIYSLIRFVVFVRKEDYKKVSTFVIIVLFVYLSTLYLGIFNTIYKVLSLFLSSNLVVVEKNSINAILFILFSIISVMTSYYVIPKSEFSKPVRKNDLLGYVAKIMGEAAIELVVFSVVLVPPILLWAVFNLW